MSAVTHHVRWWWTITGAESYHNSNRLTFKRLSNFRQLLVDVNDTATMHVSGSNFQMSPFCMGEGACEPAVLDARLR